METCIYRVLEDPTQRLCMIKIQEKLLWYMGMAPSVILIQHRSSPQKLYLAVYLGLLGYVGCFVIFSATCTVSKDLLLVPFTE